MEDDGWNTESQESQEESQEELCCNDSPSLCGVVWWSWLCTQPTQPMQPMLPVLAALPLASCTRCKVE